MTDNEMAAKRAERELREMMEDAGTGQLEVAEETGLMDEMMARGSVVVTADEDDTDDFEVSDDRQL